MSYLGGSNIEKAKYMLVEANTQCRAELQQCTKELVAANHHVNVLMQSHQKILHQNKKCNDPVMKECLKE